ncbi:zinc finger protein-like 1 [Nilaparvata lugens]|uniref:zinc finger protein-like 1 n=1 Tax=Nilaparvata lugens TaxID=108931 RepID=UPI000B999F71|nr:zinc finger protein-like 1 [Nilaparvata lugens]
MGLCKCPKRRVTNMFCYEHRVNVCETCLVTNHPKCIVQSYLKWLQDSDYEAVCYVCLRDLKSEDCVRLLCYHIVHWKCLDTAARALPQTTAPAGYKCPQCDFPIFPPLNLVSPVADILRERLAGVNWARVGLGLPLLSEEIEVRPVTEGNSTEPPKPMCIENGMSNDAVVHVEDPILPFGPSETFGHVPRRTHQNVDESAPLIGSDVLHYPDHDENKYKRRSASEWIFRWLKSVSSQRVPGYKPGHLYRRYVMAAILAFLLLCALIVVFSKLGSIVTANDPSFLPENNPMVKFSDE